MHETHCSEQDSESGDRVETRRCTTVRDSEGQAIPCIGGSDGSLWVMGKWSMRWVSGLGAMRFQKIFGLYGLKHHIVEISGDVTDAGRDGTNNK